MSRRSTILASALAVLVLGLAALLGLGALGDRLIDSAAIDARFPEIGPGEARAAEELARPSAPLEAAPASGEPEREALSASPEAKPAPAPAAPPSTGAALAGRVVNEEGAGVAEATVFAHRRDPADRDAQRMWLTSTDAEGRFRLHELAPAPYELDAKSEDLVVGERPRLELEAGATATIEILLVRPALVSGVVLDLESLPVEGAIVGLVPPNTSSGMLALVLDEAPHVKTDESGRFSLRSGLRGRALLAAFVEEVGTSEVIELELEPGVRHEGLILRLIAAGRIEGRVLRSGEPLAGVEVSALGFDGGGFREALTDDEGRFALADASPGPYLLFTDLSEAGAPERPAVARAEVRAGETTTVLLGTEKPGVRVLGRVTHAGAPVAHAEIVFLSAGGPLLDGLGIGRSDEAGRFEVELSKSGSWIVRLDPAKGWATCEIPVLVPDAAEHVVELALPTGRIAGRVVDENGPLAKVRVQLVALGPRSLLQDVDEPDTLRTDAEGRFAFQGVPAGGWLLAASSAAGEVLGPEIAFREGEALEDVELVLAASGSVSVRARDAEGFPVARASVLVWGSSGVSAFQAQRDEETDMRGETTPSALAAGRWWIAARTDSLASEAVSVEVRADEDARVELVLVPATRLVVRMLDASGAAVHAGLSVLDAHGLDHAPLAGELEFFTRIAAEAQIVGPLAPGAYRLVARSADGRRAERPLRVEGEPERAVELVLE